MKWILPIWMVILIVYHMVKMVREMNHLTKVEIPHQLVELVQQAHQDGPINTKFDIKVSSDMRDALCAPLTVEQLATIRAAEEGAFSRRVSCRLISSYYKGGEISGVVQVSVMVHSEYSKRNLFCPETQLRIVVRHNGRKYPLGDWYVTEVEQIA